MTSGVHKNPALIDHPGRQVQLRTELESMGRRQVHKDVQTSNCGGTIPNGNCLGDSTWRMPNANWWTWGLGLNYHNPGYDFGGGSSTTNQAMSTLNDPIYGSYALTRTADNVDYFERSWWNCNCGTTNCYTNCNCNCNCACACDCNCRD